LPTATTGGAQIRRTNVIITRAHFAPYVFLTALGAKYIEAFPPLSPGVAQLVMNLQTNLAHFSFSRACSSAATSQRSASTTPYIA